MSQAFYNENDPKAAAWLRELMKEGHIAPGVVDERSISDIKPNELDGFSQCHFFAGIGGWSLALRLAGVPDEAPVWTGSCPCQPLSSAGQRKEHADERHLWPAFYSLISKRRPAIVLGEQVAGEVGREWLSGVRADMEGVGYAFGGADLCAAGVGSPQIRPRLYWMAHALGLGRQVGAKRQKRNADGRAVAVRRGQAGGLGDANGAGSLSREQAASGDGYGRSFVANGGAGWLGDAAGIGREGCVGDKSAVVAQPGYWSLFEIIECADGKLRRIEPGTFPLAHGVSGRVGLLRGYGNAIVPWLAAEFIKASLEAINS